MDEYLDLRKKDEFRVDVGDLRFQKIFHQAEYASIDGNHEKYKESQATEELR